MGTSAANSGNAHLTINASPPTPPKDAPSQRPCGSCGAPSRSTILPAISIAISITIEWPTRAFPPDVKSLWPRDSDEAFNDWQTNSSCAISWRWSRTRGQSGHGSHRALMARRCRPSDESCMRLPRRTLRERRTGLDVGLRDRRCPRGRYAQVPMREPRLAGGVSSTRFGPSRVVLPPTPSGDPRPSTCSCCFLSTTTTTPCRRWASRARHRQSEDGLGA